MKKYWNNLAFRIGAIIALVGWTPLLAIILLALIGLWPDPDPNPIGPGLLFFFTFWPAMICMLIGVIQVTKAKPAPPASRPAASIPHSQPLPEWLAGLAWFRWLVIAAGAGLAIHGALSLGSDSSRGPAAAIVLGGPGIWWGITGRMPWWFRR